MMTCAACGNPTRDGSCDGSCNNSTAIETALASDREAALRDVFAAAVLSAIVAKEGTMAHASDKRYQCDIAYVYADEMLDARKA